MLETSPAPISTEVVSIQGIKDKQEAQLPYLSNYAENTASLKDKLIVKAKGLFNSDKPDLSIRDASERPAFMPGSTQYETSRSEKQSVTEKLTPNTTFAEVQARVDSIFARAAEARKSNLPPREQQQIESIQERVNQLTKKIAETSTEASGIQAEANDQRSAISLLREGIKKLATDARRGDFGTLLKGFSRTVTGAKRFYDTLKGKEFQTSQSQDSKKVSNTETKAGDEKIENKVQNIGSSAIEKNIAGNEKQEIAESSTESGLSLAELKKTLKDDKPTLETLLLVSRNSGPDAKHVSDARITIQYNLKNGIAINSVDLQVLANEAMAQSEVLTQVAEASEGLDIDDSHTSDLVKLVEETGKKYLDKEEQRREIEQSDIRAITNEVFRELDTVIDDQDILQMKDKGYYDKNDHKILSTYLANNASNFKFRNHVPTILKYLRAAKNIIPKNR